MPSIKKSGGAKAPKAKKKRKPGRPEDTGFKPTTDQRSAVEVMAAFMAQDEIAKAVINPTSKKPISANTLRKHFRQELDGGIAKVKAKIGVNILRLSEKNAAAAIFLAKVRLGMKETLHVAHSGKVQTTPNLTVEQLNAKISGLLDKARRREPQPQPRRTRKA